MTAFWKILAAELEEALARYYRFKLLANAPEFLRLVNVDSGLLLLDLGIDPGRGATVFNSAGEEISIAIYLAPELAERLGEVRYGQWPENKVLDAFLVLVEELSHFHLILARASRSETVRQVELEYQAELDKLLMASLWFGSDADQFHRFARLLYFADHEVVSRQHEDRYREAQYQAGCWYLSLCMRYPFGNPLLHQDERAERIKAYHAPWQEKLAFHQTKKHRA